MGLWFGLKMRFGFGITMAVGQASGCSSNLTPRLGTSMCREYSPQKTGKKKKKKKELQIKEKSPYREEKEALRLGNSPIMLGSEKLCALQSMYRTHQFC